MSKTGSKLILQNFQESYNKNRDIHLLEEALVYLKLREFGCPNKRALTFIKKKQKGIDGTAVKDGPAGFRNLVPVKSSQNLKNGWLIGQKHKYKGLKGYSEEALKNISKQKRQITKFNEKSRKQLQILRKRQKQQNQGFLRVGENKILLQQLSSLKDQFLKDREKRNLFLSYSGMRMQQYTRQYFEKIEDIDPQSLILQLTAFSGPLNDEKIKIEKDLEIAKGRSLSSYEIEGEKKKKSILNFRKTFNNLEIKSKEKDNFNKILSLSSKRSMSSTMKTFNKDKKMKNEREFQDFNQDIQKLIFLKRRQSNIS